MHTCGAFAGYDLALGFLFLHWQRMGLNNDVTVVAANISLIVSSLWYQAAHLFLYRA